MAHDQGARRPTALVTVGDVMTIGPVCVGIDETVGTALGIMRRGGFHHLPVLDDAGGLVGVVTHCDLLHPQRGRWADGVDGGRRLEDVAIGPAVTVAPETPVREAGRYLLPDPLSCLLVVDTHGRAVGILTARDVLRHLLAEG